MFFKLTLSNFRVHRVRALLTICAIALAVSLIVSVTSGFESLRATAQRFLTSIMGSVDATVTRPSVEPGGVKESLVAELKKDPAVRNVIPRIEESASLIDREGNPITGKQAVLIGIDRAIDASADGLNTTDGTWFDGDSGDVAVVDQVAAELLKVKVGDSFTVTSATLKLQLKVVGIVRKPQILAGFVQSVYVPIKTAQKFFKIDTYTRLGIELKANVDAKAFAQKWKMETFKADKKLRFKLKRDAHDEMDMQLQGLELVSYLGGTISMLAATFIVFSAQSMGVSERKRVLAMMRAIGCYRSQIGWLVIVEGLVLGIAGLIVGVPLGMLWVKLLSLQFDAVFAAGIVTNWNGILFAAVGTTLAALIASALPAFSAMRVSPLDAMQQSGKPSSSRFTLICGLIGVTLMSFDSMILFAPQDLLDTNTRFFLHFIVGLPCIMLGFFLLAPLLVKMIEKVGGRILAPIFGLQFAMIRQQLSGGIWRAAGTCAALMVGLAALVTMQTNGNSMLEGWQLPTQFPDFFMYSSTDLNEEQQQKLAKIEGIREDQFLPIAIKFPGLTPWGILKSIMPDATTYLGLDPDKAMEMMKLDFRDGTTPKEAAALLKKGMHVLVTQEFREIKGLKKGDKIKLETEHGEKDFTIAGVIWSPGIDLITSQFDLGNQMDQRTVGSIFGSMEDAKREFGVKGVRLFAANLDLGVAKESVMENINRELGLMGIQAGDVRQIKADMIKTFRKILLLVSSVAFAAMAVSSLGVTNTIMASIRSRRWQFGILRSIGLTRWQLIRLVIVEALLLGAVGVAMGLGSGFLIAFNAKKLGAMMMGNNPPMVVPWHMIGIGTGTVILISILASLWPAVSVSREQPLALLQAGRAST